MRHVVFRLRFAGYDLDPMKNGFAMRNTRTGSSLKTLSIDHVLSRNSQQSCVPRKPARISSFTSSICSGRPAMPPLIRLVDTSTHWTSRSGIGPPGPS